MVLGTSNVCRSFFEEDDITEILQITPSRRNETDFVSWFPEKKGMFTVRSAYRMALFEEMLKQDRGATSARPDGASPSWDLIWKCPVPAKVKICAWKISRNALATQKNMQRRGMATTSLCQICGQEDEDTIHTFMRCPHARDLWRAMSDVWGLPDAERLRPSGYNWLIQLLHMIPEQQRAMVLMILWRI
jgi:hypothetical protein